MTRLVVFVAFFVCLAYEARAQSIPLEHYGNAVQNLLLRPLTEEERAAKKAREEQAEADDLNTRVTIPDALKDKGWRTWTAFVVDGRGKTSKIRARLDSASVGYAWLERKDSKDKELVKVARKLLSKGDQAKVQTLLKLTKRLSADGARVANK